MGLLQQGHALVLQVFFQNFDSLVEALLLFPSKVFADSAILYQGPLDIIRGFGMMLFRARHGPINPSSRIWAIAASHIVYMI